MVCIPDPLKWNPEENMCQASENEMKNLNQVLPDYIYLFGL